MALSSPYKRARKEGTRAGVGGVHPNRGGCLRAGTKVQVKWFAVRRVPQEMHKTIRRERYEGLSNGHLHFRDRDRTVRWWSGGYLNGTILTSHDPHPPSMPIARRLSPLQALRGIPNDHNSNCLRSRQGEAPSQHIHEGFAPMPKERQYSAELSQTEEGALKTSRITHRNHPSPVFVDFSEMPRVVAF